MNKPYPDLRWLRQVSESKDKFYQTRHSKSAKRLLNYIEYLEFRAEAAEAYAEKHANMYVEQQNQLNRFKS